MKSILSTAKSLFQAFAGPFNAHPFGPGKAFSELERTAQEKSLSCTEWLFAEAPFAGELEAATSRFFNDDEAPYALKKSVHVIVETQLRILAVQIQPPRSPWYDLYKVEEGHHPLNPHIVDVLDANSPNPVSIGRLETLRLWLSTALLAIVLMIRAFWIAIRWGVKHVQPDIFHLAWVDGAPTSAVDGLHAAARDKGLDTDKLICVITTDKGKLKSQRDGYTEISGGDFRVPIRRWFSDVLLPAIRLSGTVAKILFLCRDPRTLTIAREVVRIAYHSLWIWRVAFNIKCTWVLDNIEYSHLPILKSLVFRKFGAKTARWQISQVDSHGSGLSYMTYDAWLAGGPYQENTYGRSWAPGCKTVPVGLPSLDRRMTHGKNLVPEYISEIENRLSRGQRMAVYFGQRSQLHQLTTWFEPLAAMIDVLANRPGWFLVIKSKHGTSTLDALLDTDPRTQEWRDADNIVSIHYPNPGTEVCPTGWLAERMTFGTSIGSAQIECLVRGKPVISFLPVHLDTECERHLRKDGLYHREPETLASAIKSFVEHPDNHSIDFTWYQHNFDAPMDDQALDRALNYLLTASPAA